MCQVNIRFLLDLCQRWDYYAFTMMNEAHIATHHVDLATLAVVADLPSPGTKVVGYLHDHAGFPVTDFAPFTCDRCGEDAKPLIAGTPQGDFWAGRCRRCHGPRITCSC